MNSEDGIKLVGNYWNVTDPKAPAILMLHGVNSSRSQFDKLGSDFAARGYAVLAINFRAHGDSTGDERSFGLFEAKDAHTAFAWLKARRPNTRVGVIGMSLGGAAAVLGDEGPVPADAMVLTVVYPDIRHAVRNRMIGYLGTPLGTVAEPILSYQARLRFGVWPDALSPEKGVAAYKGPLLVIGGEHDSYTPPDETRAIYAAANSPKELWIVPGAGHSEADRSPEYEARVLSFFEGALRARSAR